MKSLLVKMNASARDTSTLDEATIKRHVTAYEKVIAAAEKECPLQSRQPEDGKRGKVAQGKARNLLDRLRVYQAETLRFLTHPLVPFTNNRSENDIRMTKVQQKISDCFRSALGAQVFCRIRGYLLTCQKHGVSAAQALESLFVRQFPESVRYLLAPRAGAS